MSIKLILFGVTGIILATFALTSIGFKWNSKGKQGWFIKFLLTLIAILGLGMTAYSGKVFWQGRTKPKHAIPTQPIKKPTKAKNHANAKERLQLPMAYHTIEATHPSVYNFKEKWNGYKYWMAITAYPKGSAEKENPHILASNDLLEWEAPNGYKNPMDEPTSQGDDAMNRPLQYNSDTHIVYNEEKEQIEVFWRYVDDVTDTVTIFRSETKDGIQWSDKHSIYTAPRKNGDWVSPAFIKDSAGYKVWYVANGYRIWYRESTDGEKWSEPIEIKVPYADTSVKMHHWHLDVQPIDDHYEMIVVGFRQEGKKPSLNERHTMNLYHSTSTDGQSWAPLKPIVYPSGIPDAWDGQGIYRSAFIKENNNYYVFYSGIGFDATRGIGLAYGPNINDLKGIDFSNTKDLHPTPTKSIN